MRSLAAMGVMAASLFACTPHDVVRSRNGELYVERFISARAYEAFVRGRIAEERGRADEAIEAYRTSVDADPDNTLAKHRLAGLLCTRDASEADALFDDAKRRGDDGAALRLGEGRCHLARRELERAARDGFEALVAAPEDPDVVAAVVRLWRDAGQNELGALLEREAVLAGMRSPAGVTDPSNPLPPAPAPETLDAVDSALLRGDLPLARRLATGARITPAELALRAAAFDRLDIAREQALLVARADPDDANAAVARIAAEGPTLENLRALRTTDRKTLSPLGALTLDDILRRETWISIDLAIAKPTAIQDRATASLRSRFRP